MNKREEMLANLPIHQLFWRLAIPSMVGMMVQALYSIVDRQFIGNIPEIGQIAIGGIGVYLPLQFIQMGFSMLFGIGGAANISIAIGKKDYERANKIFSNVLFMLMISGIVISSIYTLFTEPILKVYGATPENMPYAAIYMNILAFGYLFNVFAFSFAHLIRSEGNSQYAMIPMLVGAITNTVLDYLFINIFHWGVAGAAYATVIAQILSFVIGASYYLTGKSFIQLRREYLAPSLAIIFSIISIGFSPFFMQVAGSFIGGILNNSLKIYGGTLAQGAYAIISSVSMMVFMPVFAMNQALQPIIGYNFGAKNFDRVKQGNKVGFFYATLLMTVGFALVQLFARPIVGVMTSNEELLSLTADGIKIFSLAMPLIGFQVISVNFFQSIGRAKISFLLSLSRQVLFLIPALFLMPRILGLKGVWMAVPIADTVGFIATMLFLIKEYKKLDENSPQNTYHEAHE